MTQASRKIKIVYVYGKERGDRWQRYKQGTGPDDFLYGANHFDQERFDMHFIERDLNRWSLWRVLWAPIEYVVTRLVGMGFSLHIVAEQWKILREADVIVSTVDTVGLPLSLLHKYRIIGAPLIYLSQGLSDRLDTLQKNSSALYRLIQRCYAAILSATKYIVVLGEGAVAPLQRHSNQPLPLKAVPFGVDSTFWRPAATTSEDGKYLLSIGSDAGRDYETLLKAAPEAPLHVVTKQELPASLITKTMIVDSRYSDVELRSLYQRAALVIIPLHDIAQPSGQSATLQAMACGKTVILTQTRGLWEPEVMQHQKNCYLVPPYNPIALAQAIAYLLAQPQLRASIGQAARQTVEKHYSSTQFGRRLQQFVESALLD